MAELHQVAYLGDLDAVRELLRAGADPNARDEPIYTSSHRVAFMDRLPGD